MIRRFCVRRRTNCGEKMIPCRPSTARTLLDDGTCHVISLYPVITIQYNNRPKHLVIANKVGAVAFWLSVANLYRVILSDFVVPFSKVSIYFKDISLGLLFTFVATILYVATLEPEPD